MNATDVTGPCAAVQHGLIMLMCGSQKMELQHDGKPIWIADGLVQLVENRNWTIWQFSADSYNEY